MKIPFSIDYKPQIESGEYKVQTRDGRKVRIVCWDRKKEDLPILALVYFGDEDYEEAYSYWKDGHFYSDEECDLDLFIVTPEPELTEFEKGIKRGFLCAGLEDVPTGIIKDTANELLAIAKKELCNSCVLKEMDETPFWPSCYCGGNCTNPFRDCINCPRRHSTIGINTTTGTSTSKVEG